MFQPNLKGYLFCLTTAFVVFSSSLRAAEEMPKNFVVLIGISDYADKQIKPRPKAENDARALYDLFTSKEYLGVRPDHVKLLLGKPDGKRGSEPATRENILKAVRWLADNARKDDLVVFSFVGEGAPLGDKGDQLGYLGVDSTLKDRAKTGVSATEIQQVFDKLKSQHFCALVDVNFHGYEKGPVAIAEGSVPHDFYREYLGPTEKGEAPTTPGRAIFLANNGFRTPINHDNNGLFTYAVLEGLKGKADTEGYEPDGAITTDELAAYVKKRVPELARPNATTPRERRERFADIPPVYISSEGNFPLTHNPSVADAVRKRINALSSLAEEQKISAEMAIEGRELLSLMPKLKAHQDLRKKYQKLVDGTVTPENFAKERRDLLDGLKVKPGYAREYADKILGAIHQVQESYVKETNQGDLVSWAIRGLYRKADEKPPTDIQERLAKIKTLKEPQLKELLIEVRERLGARDDLDKHKDIDASLQAMMGRLDPHTMYIDPNTVTRFRTETMGNFQGIGIHIAPKNTNEYLKVLGPIKNSPAYKAGIKAGDMITSIVRLVDDKGKPLDKPETIATKGLRNDECVKLIQGEPGTKVKLVINREGHEGPVDVEVKRAQVDVETVWGARRNDKDDWDFMIDPTDRVGYIRIGSFARHTARDVAAAMRQLNGKKLQGLIMDLRGNPGGLLPSAVNISDLFIDDGLIVTVRPRVGEPQSFNGEDKHRVGTLSYLSFPMVILVDGGSASGSEIVAACLQDHKRAVIMGERSYGKGSVQTIMPFEGGEMKITNASFWRPSGKNLNKASTHGEENEDWGVIPNKGFVLKLSNPEKEELYRHMQESEIITRRDVGSSDKGDDFKDRQLGMALDYLKNQIAKNQLAKSAKGQATKAAQATSK